VDAGAHVSRLPLDRPRPRTVTAESRPPGAAVGRDPRAWSASQPSRNHDFEDDPSAALLAPGARAEGHLSEPRSISPSSRGLSHASEGWSPGERLGEEDSEEVELAATAAAEAAVGQANGRANRRAHVKCVLARYALHLMLTRCRRHLHAPNSLSRAPGVTPRSASVPQMAPQPLGRSWGGSWGPRSPPPFHPQAASPLWCGRAPTCDCCLVLDALLHSPRSLLEPALRCSWGCRRCCVLACLPRSRRPPGPQMPTSMPAWCLGTCHRPVAVCWRLVAGMRRGSCELLSPTRRIPLPPPLPSQPVQCILPGRGPRG
jgi:hypothetical protein